MLKSSGSSCLISGPIDDRGGRWRATKAQPTPPPGSVRELPRLRDGDDDDDERPSQTRLALEEDNKSATRERTLTPTLAPIRTVARFPLVEGWIEREIARPYYHSNSEETEPRWTWGVRRCLKFVQSPCHLLSNGVTS